MDTFKKNPEIKKFSDFNFTPIVNHLNVLKEKRKNLTSDEKKVFKNYEKKTKLEKEAKDKVYGNAIVDNVLEKIGGYLIEAPTLFKGRGAHPKAG